MQTTRIAVSLENLGKNPRVSNFRVPKKAVRCDRITGVSQKGCNYEIISFFDSANNLIKRCSTFLDRFGNSSAKIANYRRKKDEFFKVETIYSNGKETKFSATDIVPSKNEEKKGFRLTKEEHRKDGDYHTILYLKPGKQPNGLQYKCKWDSFVMGWRMIGEHKWLTKIKNIHLIPLIVSQITPNRVQQRIKLISMHEAKKLGVQDMFEPVMRCTLKELNPDKDLKKSGRQVLAMGGYIPFTEYIGVLDLKKKSCALVKTLSHEFKHLQDSMNMARLEDFDSKAFSHDGIDDFVRKARKKGVITKQDKDYELYKGLEESLKEYNYSPKTVEEHDSHILEQRANEWEEEERESFKKMARDLEDLFLE